MTQKQDHKTGDGGADARDSGASGGVQPESATETHNSLGRGADTRKDDETNAHKGGATGTGGPGGVGGSVL
jgi:hypothetical protein